MAPKQAICPKFRPFTLIFLSTFKPIGCILHHFTLLVWLPTPNFSSPITHFLPLKSHFLMGILPLLAMFFKHLEGFVYTIAAHFYSFRLAFSTILHCVLHHFALHLAAFYLAFCTKTHCVLHQNALHLAPKRSTFSCKWLKIWCR